MVDSFTASPHAMRFNVNQATGSGKTAVGNAFACWLAAIAQAHAERVAEEQARSNDGGKGDSESQEQHEQTPVRIITATPYVTTCYAIHSSLLQMRCTLEDAHWELPTVVLLLGKESTCRWDSVRNPTQPEAGEKPLKPFADRCAAARASSKCLAFEACKVMPMGNQALEEIENLG
jgi:hypothetical protein